MDTIEKIYELYKKSYTVTTDSRTISKDCVFVALKGEHFDGNDFGRFVARIPERRLMWRAQTPQAFRLPLIRDAYQRALQDPQFNVTDDCGVVRKYMPGTKITVVEGSEKNMKITHADDLSVMLNYINNG